MLVMELVSLVVAEALMVRDWIREGKGQERLPMARVRKPKPRRTPR